MAGDYSKKTQTDNKHLSNLTSARQYPIDGGKATDTIRPKCGRLMRVIISTKGLAFTINDGSKPLFVAATTTAEGTYDIGVYCDTNIKLAGCSGTGFALVAFDE